MRDRPCRCHGLLVVTYVTNSWTSIIRTHAFNHELEVRHVAPFTVPSPCAIIIRVNSIDELIFPRLPGDNQGITSFQLN